MDLRKKYGTDKQLETDGIDLHLGEDAYITVARAGGANARYETEMRRAHKANKRAVQMETLDNREAEKILKGVLARTVVLGWRGIVLDGKPLDFSQDNCLLLFEELPEVYRVVLDESQKLANFRAEEISDEGNASAPT